MMFKLRLYFERYRVTKWVFVIGIVLISVFGVAQVFNYLYPLKLDRYHDTSPVVLDGQGQLISILLTRDEQYRWPVVLADIDPGFIEQLILYEDKRFYSHMGIDPLAILRASWQLLKTGKIISGASTLTLQTARLLEHRSRTFKNKLIECCRALQLEYYFSKQEILEIYLTLAPYGGNVEGIQAACYTYLGKSPQQLTPAEAAFLVVLPQHPARFSKDTHSALTTRARNKVLTRTHHCLSNQYTRKDLLDRALDEAMQDSIPTNKVSFPNVAPHLARRLLSQNPSRKQFDTFIDLSLQRKAETFLRSQLNFLQPKQTVAAIMVDNKTKAILAYVGSADFKSEARAGQVDMIAAIRSPGSTLKPFIYAMGFEEQWIHPETLINDAPTRFNDYMPANFNNTFQGQLKIREALQKSLNIPAVAVLERLGPGHFLERLRSLGIALRFKEETIKGSLPIALGGVGSRLSDLVALYSALATNGQFSPLQYFKNQQPSPVAHSTHLVNAASAHTIQDILEDTPLPEGSVDWNLTKQGPIAYKTGTSYGFRDALAIGFTEDYTVGVWVGRPDGSPSLNCTGGSHAAPILFTLFNLLPNRGSAERKTFKRTQVNQPIASQCLEFKNQNGKDENELKIIFPTPDTIISLQDDPENVTSLNTIPVSFSGGKPPFYCLENGEPVFENIDKQEIKWPAKAAGFWEITILDSEGRSASTSIEVRL